MAELPGTEEILNGTFIPGPGTDTYTAQFLAQLKMAPEVRHTKPVTRVISTESYQTSWKQMKAHTSSSPFGPEFVHYIAGSRDLKIAEFDTTMANILYASGYNPTEWTKFVDVLIPKKSSSAAIEKLWIIVLFHSLFNLNNKRLVRDMIAHAEKLKQIPWEIYGSRKGHCAIECTANKVFTTDLARQEHLSMALCAKDAKSCLNRILHAITTICMRQIGVTKQTCFMMLGTLAQAKYYIQTTYGDSTTSYSCIEIPFQGLNQGNGTGPGIWMLVSIPIINMLKARGFGFKVANAMSQDQLSFVCHAFVDDTDLVHASDQDIVLDGLVDEMQSVVDTWEGGLRASGGALVPDKSYWYLIHFTFQNN